MKHLILALAALAAGNAHAAWKCVSPDGSVSLQQQPCGTGERAEALNIPRPAASDRPEYIRQAIESRRIVAGMTRAELDQVMRVNADAATRSVYGDRVSVQLVYYQYRRTLYVYLDDGIVTSTSETER